MSDKDRESSRRRAEKGNAASEGEKEQGDEEEEEGLEPRWAGESDHYPLRDKEEDPGWAIGVVNVWLGFCLFSLGFILWLILMSFFYD